jgi:hypothetical protein
LRDQEAGWLVSLWDDPILWGSRDDFLANGQHRVCALKTSGADCGPIVLLDAEQT